MTVIQLDVALQSKVSNCIVASHMKNKTCLGEGSAEHALSAAPLIVEHHVGDHFHRAVQPDNVLA
jgi:hypothetical protein